MASIFTAHTASMVSDLLHTNNAIVVYQWYLYLITLIPMNIMNQLQCISASAAGTSAIPVTDK